MNNTKQTNNNTEDSFSERRAVARSEGEAVTELSPSNGSDHHINREDYDFEDYENTFFCGIPSRKHTKKSKALLLIQALRECIERDANPPETYHHLQLVSYNLHQYYKQ